MRIEIPPGECRTAYNGYPWAQLERIFQPTTVSRLEAWMTGQTMMICDGSAEREWVDDESDPYVRRFVEVGPPKCDSAHGLVVYEWDLHDFLGGRPTRD